MNKPEETQSFQSFEKSPYFSTKYKSYFSVYDKLFSEYRGQAITFIEVGVLQGGSLFMWRDFFGPKARIIGIDLNPDAKRWEEHGFEIFIGDQSQPHFWESFSKKVPNFDILLDDGGHTNLQQLVTLFEMSKTVKPHGLIIIEDTHTSYQKEFGNPGRHSFINVSKRLIDNLNLQFDNPGAKKVHPHRINSIEYFESIVAFKFGAAEKDLNSVLNNHGIHLNNLDFRYANHNQLIKLLQKIESALSLNYEKVGQHRSYLRVLNIIVGNPMLKNLIKIIIRPIHKFIQFTISSSLKIETHIYLSKIKH
jgi:hypothetical protein